MQNSSFFFVSGVLWGFLRRHQHERENFVHIYTIMLRILGRFEISSTLPFTSISATTTTKVLKKYLTKLLNCFFLT